MYIQHANIMTDIYTDVYTKPNKDPNALKISSFRTKEGVWAEFCNKAESIGLTATDVLKAAMEQFINGEYQPTVGASTQHHDNVLTCNDVLEIVNTVISTLSIPNDESIHTLVSTHINTTVTRLTELETSTHSQLVEFKEQLKKLEDRSAVTTNPSPTTPTTTPQTLTWAEFCDRLGVDLPPSNDRRAPAGQKMIALAVEKGIVGWKYNSNKNRFEVANDN